MISSVITFLLKRLSALSIDSPEFTVTTAIYFSNLVKDIESLFNTLKSLTVKCAKETPRAIQVRGAITNDQFLFFPVSP